MKLLNKIFTGIVCGTLMTTSVLGADDCSNLKYKQAHPERCRYVTNGGNTSTYLMVGAGAVAAGAAVALLAGGANGGGSSSGGANPATQSYGRMVTPTMIMRTHVGEDVDTIQLASAISSNEYDRNANQYDDIQLAYSIARGYTGKNSTIAVFDTRLGTVAQHAEYVMDTITPIAPSATVKLREVASNTHLFKSYAEIGDIIASTNGANIYNNSWNVSSIFANEIKTRNQFANLTSQNFVDSISYAATEKDAIIVWAAGNDSNAQSGMLSAMPLVMPELNNHFINVVAWDSETRQLADYSNACGVTKNFCITAPGTITMTDSITTVQGTSFAAPVVSAAIAVIRQAWPTMTSAQITSLLFETAADLGDAGVDEIYGHGMLDMEAATRPVGAPTIMVSNNVAQPLQIARVSGQIAHNIKSANPSMAFFDKYGRDFKTSVTDNVSVHNRGIGFERLRGDDARMKFEFGDMEFGFYRNDMLSSTGFLATDGDTTTTYIGTNKSYKLGDIELFGHTQMGVARPRASEQSVISEFSNIYTASAYVGVRGNDWSLSFGMPDTIVNGTMNLHLASGRNSGGDITYQDYKIDMASTPAIEYTANWKFVTAGYVDNPYGNDEFYIFAKTKFAF
ncbi:MAG: S8 family serine peptidase [Alphaproteobacteria bacterium]|nr:S8 family serine peptidase [Alphaproteobacteria bacterium]